MPKKVSFYSNERIDIGDLEQTSQDFSQQQQQQLLNRSFLDKLARVGDGFRIEIANQVSNPGSLTVHNGVSYDRSGQIISNEDDLNTARSITLSVNGTYYLEVQFVSSFSEVDARAFIDPTYDNGVDPSGDQRLAGREFGQNVATRKSPDWQIITPVSTTGFDIVTNYNSLKIPLAVITVTGGVITGGSTIVAKTTLETAASIGQSVLKVFDSRIMPNSFTGQVDSESVSVISNDRENGILTLSAILTASHLPGARFFITGGAALQFLPERLAPISKTSAFPNSGSQDARPRAWMGDEERGYGLSQNPELSAGSADTQIKSLKDYIDFISGQIREIKWGSARSSDLGISGPPAVISNPPRYYDRASGLLGAKTATATVGDGIVSWGDFNVSSYTTVGTNTAFRQALQAAVDSLPSNGGMVFIKHSGSPYIINDTALSISKPVRFTGDSLSSVIINGTGTLPIINILSSSVRFENIAFSSSANSEIINIANSLSDISIIDCTMSGSGINTLGVAAGNTVSDLIFDHVTSTCPGGLFSSIGDNNQRFIFEKCIVSFAATSTNKFGIKITQTIATSAKHKILNCEFVETGVRTATSCSAIFITHLNDCLVLGNLFTNCDQGVRCDVISGTVFENNRFINDNGFGRKGILFESTAAWSGNVISNSTFYRLSDPTIGYVTGIEIDSIDFHGLVIRDCEFNTIGNAGLSFDAFGSRFINSTAVIMRDIKIYGNTFTDINTDQANLAVDFSGGVDSGVFYNVIISNNSVHSIGNTVATSASAFNVSKFNGLNIHDNEIRLVGNVGSIDSAGIAVGAEANSSLTNGNNLVINNNIFSNILGPGTLNTYCIEVANGANKGSICNNIMDIGNSNVGGILIGGGTGVGSIRELTINNNVMSGNNSYGIFIVMPVGDTVQKKFIISKNCITSSLAAGIHVDLGSNNAFPSVMITNNIIDSGDASVVGIELSDMDMAVVNGNNISLSAANNACVGISLTNVKRFTANDNIIYCPGTAGIRGNAMSVFDAKTGVVASNQFIMCYPLFFSASPHVIHYQTNLLSLNPIADSPVQFNPLSTSTVVNYATTKNNAYVATPYTYNIAPTGLGDIGTDIVTSAVDPG